MGIVQHVSPGSKEPFSLYISAYSMFGVQHHYIHCKIHKCVLVFKCLHNLVPPYLSNYFIRNYNVHGYNTRRKADLHLPKPKLSLGKRTFRFSGTALFNSLPCKIQQAVSLSSFKNLVKAHFIYST